MHNANVLPHNIKTALMEEGPGPVINTYKIMTGNASNLVPRLPSHVN